MAVLNLPTPEIASSAPARAKRVRIPDRILQAIRLITTGEVKTQKAAAERVGISDNYLCKMLGKEHVRVFMAREASKTIAGASLRASRRLVELIDATSEHVSAQVSERILVSEGLLRSDATQVAVNVAISPGYVIDVSAAPLLQHEPQSQAKALTDKGSVPNDE